MDKTARNLIIEYLQKARGKLQAAHVLLREGLFDDSVSRSYYAAFHAAQAVLLAEGQKAETHHGVVTLFGLHLVRSGKLPKKLGRLLANLKDDRENSDYEALSWVDRERAGKAVAEAEEFVEEVEKYLRLLPGSSEGESDS